MKNRFYSIQMLAALFMLFSLTAFSQMKFEAKLTSSQEVHSVNSNASGTAVFNLTDEGLEYVVTVSNMTTADAGIYMGKIGEDGDKVKSLTFTNNVASGVWASSDGEPFTEAEIEALLKGELYVNVTSDSYPNGEIRGQVENSSSVSFTAVLNGDQVAPSVETSTKGTAVFNYTAEGIKYSITVSGSEATEAKIYMGARGVDGEAVKTIELENNSAVGVWTSSDSEALTDEAVMAMFKNELYVEVNTTSNTSGEVRGQIELDGGINFSTALTGEDVEPEVGTEASGTANFTLTPAGLSYEIAVDSLNITSAALYSGAEGTNGEMLVDISSSVEGNTVIGFWSREDDSDPLTASIMAEMIAGNVYLVIGSAAHPYGELRGQLEFNTEASLNVRIENVTDGETSILGVGTLKYTLLGLSYRVTLEGSSATEIHLVTKDDEGNDEVIATFDEGDKENLNTFAGTWLSLSFDPFTDDDFESMLKGEVWIEVEDTTLAGETMGYLKANADVSFNADLYSEQITSTVNSTATGTASLKLVGDRAVYFVTVNGIDITEASFMNAEVGVNGEEGLTITDNFENNTAIGVWNSSDSFGLSSGVIEAMMTGNIYLTVASGSNPNGEIRGQLELKGGFGLYAETSGSNLLSPVETEAYGSGSFTLTSRGLVYNYTAANINVENLELNVGLASEIGSTIFDFDDVSANTYVGVWSTSDSQGLTVEEMGEIVNGETYINATSSLYTDGEMRGQIKLITEESTVVGVDDEVEEGLPTNIVLKQNYPNPFNPTTNIEFFIPESGNLAIEIYNILGQKVTTLVDDNFSAGYHTVVFDGSDLASGIYIYSLRTQGHVISKKMQLIK